MDLSAPFRQQHHFGGEGEGKEKGNGWRHVEVGGGGKKGHIERNRRQFIFYDSRGEILASKSLQLPQDCRRKDQRRIITTIGRMHLSWLDIRSLTSNFSRDPTYVTKIGRDSIGTERANHGVL